MDRQFVNPLGAVSAIFGMAYFVIVVLSLLFLQHDYIVVVVFVPVLLLAIVYYYKVVESRQFFSKEEQDKFMKAYILNANRQKKKQKGLSPFMKQVREIYLALHCDKACGAWPLVSPSSATNSRQASSGSSLLSSAASALSMRRSDRSGQSSVGQGSRSGEKELANGSSSNFASSPSKASNKVAPFPMVSSTSSANTSVVTQVATYSASPSSKSNNANASTAPNSGKQRTAMGLMSSFAAAEMSDEQVMAEFEKFKTIADAVNNKVTLGVKTADANGDKQKYDQTFNTETNALSIH
jgi:hypothetical protein